MSAPGPGFTVTRENVLQAHALFASEAKRLNRIMDENGAKLAIGDCGQDPVSPEAREGYNAKLRNLKTQCENYVESLTATAAQLRATAQAYGYTEDQIRAAFSPAEASPPPLMRPDPHDPAASLLRPYLPPTKTPGSRSPFRPPQA